jgi:tRNA(fMet)-specific endonuclease VapC
MEARYLLDTNIASYIIKGNSPTLDRRLVKVPMAQLAISAVTEGELRFGAARLPHATRLHSIIEEFLLRVSVLPWDSDAAHYGHLRATLERQGKPMGNLDL